MAGESLTDQELLETVNAVRRYGSVARMSIETGMPRTTVRHRMDSARSRGLYLPEGARNAAAKAGVTGAAKAGWIVNVDPESGSRESTYWQAPDIDTTQSLLDRLRDAFEGMTPAIPIAAPAHFNADLLTVYPIADAHIGMMAWGKETGEDYNTAIACARLKSWIGQLVASSPPSAHAVILDIGDLTHADDQTNQTPASKHNLDVDTRHFRTMDLTIAALASCIDLALAKHDHVTVRILPGNHNPHSYMTIMFALAERYRLEPRATIEKLPGEFWVHRHGDVLLAAHHGDKAKPERIVMALADTHGRDWGETRFRYLFTGHKHHLQSADIGGVQWQQLRAMTAKDAYAVSHAYSARAQLEAITFDRKRGEVQRVKVGS